MMGREKGIDPNRVAMYIRWSTDDQSDGTTLEVQLDGCRHYVLSQGWRVNDALVFVDDGYSGGSLERPALTRLRHLVCDGQVDCVVVFKLDRLSRSVVDMVNLVLEEWDGLTHVKSAREPLDTSTAMGKQFFYMLVGFAEWERSVIRERTTAGRLARAREGYKASSRAPYGYCHGEARGSYAVVPEEAIVVRRMFDLYTSGLGARAIVTRLNSEGLRNRNGAMWNERTVLFMLSNPAYKGKMVYGRFTRNPRRGKVAGEPYWVRNEQVTAVENSPFIPALVSAETFARAQQIKASRRFTGTPDAASPRAVCSPYLLTGLGTCQCGYRLYAKVERRRGREHRYYSCLGKKVKGKAFCDAPNIPMDLLDQMIRKETLARYGSQLARQRWRNIVLADLDRSLAEASTLLTQVDQRIARLEAQERQVRLDYREQRISASEFQQLRTDMLVDMGHAREQREQLVSRQNSLEGKRHTLAMRVQAFAQADPWGDLGVQEQKRLVGQLISQLLVGEVSTAGKELLLHLVWHWEGSPPTEG